MKLELKPDMVDLDVKGGAEDVIRYADFKKDHDIWKGMMTMLQARTIARSAWYVSSSI